MSDIKKETVAIESVTATEKQPKQKKPADVSGGPTEVKFDYNNHERLLASEAKQTQALQNNDWQAAVTNLNIAVDTTKPLTTVNQAEATAYIVSAIQHNRPIVAQFAPLDNRLSVAGPTGNFINPVTVAARSIISNDRSKALSAMEIARSATEAGYASIVPRF
jgi:hypothetical protein